MKYDKIMIKKQAYITLLLLTLTGAKSSEKHNNSQSSNYDLYIPPTSSIVCESLKKGIKISN